MTVQAPLLSVVIPFYENQRTFTASLSSFRAQSLEGGQYEIIVVDDGSSYPAEEVMKKEPLPPYRQIWEFSKPWERTIDKPQEIIDLNSSESP